VKLVIWDLLYFNNEVRNLEFLWIIIGDFFFSRFTFKLLEVCKGKSLPNS
jgi:hypothetical protein